MLFQGLHLIENVEYEGRVNEVVYEHPNNQPYNNSLLTVKALQTAYVCYEGKIIDTFTEGRHRVSTDNIPILSEIISFLGDSKGNGINTTIYFINNASQEVFWGVPDITFKLLGNEYEGLPITVGISGKLSFAVIDGEILLTNLVIPNGIKMLGAEELYNFISGFVLAIVRMRFIEMVQSNKIDLFDIDSMLYAFNDGLRSDLGPVFRDYGLEILSFQTDGYSKNETFSRIKGAIENNMIARNKLEIISDQYDEIRVKGCFIDVTGKKIV